MANSNKQQSLEQRIQRVTSEAVEIEPYNPEWPSRFQQEKIHLLRCLPNELIKRVEHFGSTAVPGLAAKPVIDMLIGVTSLDATKARIVPILVDQGYEYFWRPTHADDGPPWYAWFIKRDPESKQRTHHLHMVEISFTEHWNRLKFRDYLIANQDAADEYRALKLDLATRHPHDRARYTQAKTKFVSRITELALRQLTPES